MTYDAVVQIALALPDVEEGLTWGTPGVKRKGRFMFRLKEDGETIAVKLDWETRDRLLSELPQVYFLTPHYEGYPALLARLSVLTEDLARPLVEASWADALKPAKRAGSDEG